MKSTRIQEVAGLQLLSAKEQEELLRDDGLKPSSPEAGSLLAIKADLLLPWNKLRKLKPRPKSFGVELESERTARQFIAKLLVAVPAKPKPSIM